MKIVKNINFNKKNERLSYPSLTDNKLNILRRNFFKYLTLSSIGLFVPIGEAKNYEAITWLIPASIEAFAVVATGGLETYAFAKNNTNIMKIKITNEKRKEIKGKIKVSLYKKENNIKYKNISTTYIDEKIPAKTTITTQIKLPEAKGKYKFHIKTRYSNGVCKFKIT